MSNPEKDTFNDIVASFADGDVVFVPGDDLWDPDCSHEVYSPLNHDSIRQVMIGYRPNSPSRQDTEFGEGTNIRLWTCNPLAPNFRLDKVWTDPVPTDPDGERL